MLLQGASSWRQGQSSSKATAHVLWRQSTVMVKVERIEDRIATEPLIASDAAVSIEIIQQEDFLNGVAEGGATLKLSQAMGQLLLQRFDGLAEALDPFTQFVGCHAIRRHQGIETILVNVDLFFITDGGPSIELALERNR